MPATASIVDRFGLHLATFGVGVWLTSSAAIAQQLEPSQIDVSALGPQVGELVPDFSLPDQDGQIWTRESIMGPRGAMLVFVRSADW
jgi:hypothetical protein